MTAKNDITRDSINTKPSSDAYRDGWDRIFGKKEEPHRRCSEREVPLPKEIDTKEKFIDWIKSQKTPDTIDKYLI